MRPSAEHRAAMHGGLQDVYYIYKMLLSTFRSRLAPAITPPPDPFAASRGAPKELRREFPA
jgi:hypothetical protein